MIFLLSSCALVEIGSINITCEDAESCDTSEDKSPDYIGGYNVNRCEETPSSAGYAVGEVSPDFELSDQHGESLRLSDFCANTVLLVGCSMWSACNQETLEAWSLEYRAQGLTIISLMAENESEETPTSADLLSWAEQHSITHPILRDPDAEITVAYLTADSDFSGSYGIPSMQVLSPGMVVERVDAWISEAELQELLN